MSGFDEERGFELVQPRSDDDYPPFPGDPEGDPASAREEGPRDPLPGDDAKKPPFGVASPGNPAETSSGDTGYPLPGDDLDPGLEVG